MSPNVFRWGRINLTSGEDKRVLTDKVLYKDRSFLLLPKPSDVNRFYVRASEDRVEFRIGSTSYENFELMKGFFTKLYDCNVEDSEQPPPIVISRPGKVFWLANIRWFRRVKASHFPSFLSNLIYLPSSMPGLKLEYGVTIVSTKKLFNRIWFNFLISIRLDYGVRNMDIPLGYIRNEVRKLRKDWSWKMKIKGGGFFKRIIYRNDAFQDPSLLYNFVRIPVEEESGQDKQ